MMVLCQKLNCIFGHMTTKNFPMTGPPSEISDSKVDVLEPPLTVQAHTLGSIKK